MTRLFGRVVPVLLAAAVLMAGPAGAQTAQEIAELKRRLLELEGKQREESLLLQDRTDTLAGELERTRLGRLLPEKAELKSEWGLGPAASSVYHVKQGLSLGAYGEGNYRSFVEEAAGKKDETDLLRLVTYLGYKFNERILFNSEIEFEHGTTDDVGGQSGDEAGEVSVEFSYLDFLIRPAVNARAGMVLVPMGFLNELHEPPYYHGVRRAEVEQVILPSTWRENGLGMFGEFDAGGKIEYRSYLVNGLRASRFSDSGIRGGRQKGNRALAEDLAWTSRLDYSPAAIPGLLAGGAFWLGNSGQNERLGSETPDVFTAVWDLHAQWKIRQLELRALGAWGSIDDANLVSQEVEKTIPEDFSGWYVEAAYDVLPHLVSGTRQYLAPFFRLEALNSQEEVPSGLARNAALEKNVYTWGLSYKPLEQVVLKLDYRNFQTDGEKETADEVAFGAGFAF